MIKLMGMRVGADMCEMGIKEKRDVGKAPVKTGMV
jgi:hypothetical protein